MDELQLVTFDSLKVGDYFIFFSKTFAPGTVCQKRTEKHYRGYLGDLFTVQENLESPPTVIQVVLGIHGR
jgi:hypothetical protein